MKMPAEVVQIRVDICKEANCQHSPDFTDSCAECPEGHWGAFNPVDCHHTDPPDTAGPFKTADGAIVTYMVAHGPRLWRELEGRALTCDLTTEAIWLRGAFAVKIPCGNCRSHWVQLLQKYPTDLSSREAYSTWIVFIHNQVNIKLGKPIFTPRLV